MALSSYNGLFPTTDQQLSIPLQPSSTLATQITTLTSSSLSLIPTSPATGPDIDSAKKNSSLRRSWKSSMGFVATLLGYLTLSSLHQTGNIPGPSNNADSLRADPRPYDQQQPLLTTSPRRPRNGAGYWASGHERPEEWTKEEHRLREIPRYVYEYTPYVHLFSGEQFWPCDIAEHLVHTSPYLNYTLIRSMDDRTLGNLDDLNSYGHFTYLQSEDNVEERPDWLGGSQNIPRSPDDIYSGSQQSNMAPPGPRKDNDGNEARLSLHDEHSEEPYQRGGHSSAPAVLIVVPKDDGVVDAFWFYFYSYNLGNQVLNVRFGNHVGDWEHSMVRFRNGTPEAVYISEHGAGQAYSYQAIEKIGKRPVIYSATGTHAIYATPGLHPYVLPWGLLHDETDRGPLWDPKLNHHGYVYNHTSRVLKSSAQTPQAPINWFYYGGHWGDKIYPMNDGRQYRFLGQYHYVSGPFGPRFKNLGRKKVCQRLHEQCVIRHWLGDDKKVERWPGVETGEDLEEGEDGTGSGEGV